MAITIDGAGTITGISVGGLNDGIITQPDLASGVAGTGPAFSAFQSSAQTAFAANTDTKVAIQTKEWDTASCFDNTTNYSFTPNVAGYYLITGSVSPGVSATAVLPKIYKNGSPYRYGNYVTASASAQVVSTVVYMNGTTDYVELYGFFGTSQAPQVSSQTTYFQGTLVRAT